MIKFRRIHSGMLSINKEAFKEYEIINENYSDLSVVFVEPPHGRKFVYFYIYTDMQRRASFPASENYDWRWGLSDKDITIENILSIHPLLGRLLIKNIHIVDLNKEMFCLKNTIKIELELFKEHILSEMEYVEE